MYFQSSLQHLPLCITLLLFLLAVMEILGTYFWILGLLFLLSGKRSWPWESPWVNDFLIIKSWFFFKICQACEEWLCPCWWIFNFLFCRWPWSCTWVLRNRYNCQCRVQIYLNILVLFLIRSSLDRRLSLESLLDKAFLASLWLLQAQFYREVMFELLSDFIWCCEVLRSCIQTAGIRWGNFFH